MLQRTPKPAFWKLVKNSAKVLFVVEAVLFAASYGAWYRMNTNGEFRHYMHENFPLVLETYYNIGELVGDNKIRQIDLNDWTKPSGKKSN